MRRWSVFILSVLMMFGVWSPISGAAGTIAVTAATYDPSAKTVTITGALGNTPGKIVTIQVRTPTNQLDYINQGLTGANGSYQFQYKLTSSAYGTYRITVGGEDASGTAAASFEVPDREPPAWSSGSIMTASEVTRSEAVLTWSGAADHAGITGYKLFLAAGGSYTESAALGNVTTYKATGLLPNHEYTYTVKAGDAAGNWSDYGPSVTLRTARIPDDSPPPPQSPPGTTTPPPVISPPAEVVGGELQLNLDEAARITHETSADGNSVMKAAVDGGKLTEAFADQGVRVVVVDLNSNDAEVIVELPAAALANAGKSNPQASVLIKTVGATYLLPVRIFGSLPADAVVTVSIQKISGTSANDVNGSARQNGSKPLLDEPVDFTVEVNGGTLTDFHGIYVERSLHVSAAADPAKVTGVWYEPNGGIRFIPSVIASSGGSSQITIRSPHNSIYSVVESDKSFADTANHWAKADIELLANKLIVQGVADDQFAPERSVTRAEFASLLVRALGLEESKGAAFKDISASDWFYGAVSAAQQAELVTGYEDGTFRPQESITREQMVTMIVRAAKTGGKDIQYHQTQLATYSDQALIADWARDAAGKSLAAGIIQGTTSTTFSPRDEATRAQSVTMLKRMLSYLQFIN